jgi:NADH-ubiquinone oxidoreductase chain 6
VELLINISDLKLVLTFLAIISGILVISTRNAVISVFNLIVLYILVAFYLMYLGITYLGISYIIIYIGAIAILFLFVIMIIDVEVLETRSNNYIPLLLILLFSFVVCLKNIISYLGKIKIKDNLLINDENMKLFNLGNINDYKLIEENVYCFKNSGLNVNKEMFEISESIINSLPEMKEENYLISNYNHGLYDNNFLFIMPDWDSALSRITQISGIGDVLYTVYHSYIYIVSIILLLSMVGAIILTRDNDHEIKIVTKKRNSILNSISLCRVSTMSMLPFFELVSDENIYSNNIIDNLMYFILFNIMIGILLLLINFYFSLSVKYLEKGGGFECGFTSFVQTRERFNVIFYRVSLLFLVFDLEIILAFPYTAVYQKNQNISKNNILAFLYILIVGFIYELKEGALNIVKKVENR